MTDQRPTPRERAERICVIYKATRNADHATKCGECQRVIAEIEAAVADAREEERVQAEEELYSYIGTSF